MQQPATVGLCGHCHSEGLDQVPCEEGGSVHVGMVEVMGSVRGLTAEQLLAWRVEGEAGQVASRTVIPKWDQWAPLNSSEEICGPEIWAG